MTEQKGNVGILVGGVPAPGINGVIAAAVIGGISLRGGRGSIIGTIGGMLVLSSIDSGLILLDVPAFWIRFTTGVVIFVAILIDTLKTRFVRV